jgi:hypothetical protein
MKDEKSPPPKPAARARTINTQYGVERSITANPIPIHGIILINVATETIFLVP